MINQGADDFDFEVGFVGTRITEKCLRSSSDRGILVFSRRNENFLCADEGIGVVVKRIEFGLSNNNILISSSSSGLQVLDAGGVRSETSVGDCSHEGVVSCQRVVQVRLGCGEFVESNSTILRGSSCSGLGSVEVSRCSCESLLRFIEESFCCVQRIKIFLGRIGIESSLGCVNTVLRFDNSRSSGIAVGLCGCSSGQSSIFGICSVASCNKSCIACCESGQIVFREAGVNGSDRIVQRISFCSFGVDHGLRGGQFFFGRSGLCNLDFKIVVSTVHDAAVILATEEDVRIFFSRIIADDGAVEIVDGAGFLRSGRSSKCYSNASDARKQCS